MVRPLSNLQEEIRDAGRSLPVDGTIVNQQSSNIPVDRFKFELAESALMDRVSLNPNTLLIKRAFDIVLSALLIIVSLPIFLIAVAIVSIFKGKSVFVYDERVGLNGKVFTHYVLNVYQILNKPRNRT